MNFRALAWGKGLAYIGGGGCIAIFALGGPRLLLIGAAVAAAAKLIDLLIPQPTQNLRPTAEAVNNAGQVIGINVTTTTKTPIEAPQKGAP